MATKTTKARTAERAGDIPSLILQAALRLFTERGYFNTSIHDIRREADVSIGAIYHYFANKELIAKALYDHLVSQMAEEMLGIMASNASAHDRCRSVVQRLFAMTETDPEMMHFILDAKHREFLPSEKPVCSSKPFELMKTMVEEGMKGGEIRNMDGTVAAACLFGGALRMIHLRMDNVIAAPLMDHFDQVWSSSWRAVATA